MKVSDNANGHFKNGEKHSFPGKPAKAGKPAKNTVDVIIPPGLAAKFDVVEKDFDDNLPDTVTTSAGTYTMLWINNIGLEPKAGVTGAPDDDYELQFDLFTIEGATEYKYFYYLNGTPYQVDDEDFAKFETNFAVRLRLTDPSSGLGGR